MTKLHIVSGSELKMAKIVTLLAFLSLAVLYSDAACVNPTVTSKTYTTSDSLMSTETVFIVEVDVNCDGADSLSIHALVGDQLVQAAKAVGPNVYQVSWKESHDKSKTGKRIIKFFDDEGTASIKKSVRYGKDMTAEPLFTVDMDHRGVKSGLWVAPSFVAVIIAVFVWWLAYTTKTKLQD